jgi:DNA-binding NtrC family response regulator
MDGRIAVLIVDSDAAVRRVLRLAVEGAGYSCIACASAEEAQSLVDRHRPAFVLSEVRLAGAGGQTLATQLAQRDGWRPRVALMSAYPRPRRGAEDYFVAKPIEFDQLLHLLETLDRELVR